MSLFETIFAIANPVALLGWLGLVVFPGRKLVVDGISGLLIPALLGVAYAALIGAFFAGADGGFSSIAAVRLLFQSDALLVAGWLHYLAFDLFVGAWQVRTARAEGIPHLARHSLPGADLPVRSARACPLPHHPLRAAAARRPGGLIAMSHRITPRPTSPPAVARSPRSTPKAAGVSRSCGAPRWCCWR